MPFKIVDIHNSLVKVLCEKNLLLIRPDHHVAWRGDSIPAGANSIINNIRGAA